MAPFSARRPASGCPLAGFGVTFWAVARLRACSSMRSALKSSSRTGSGLSQGEGARANRLMRKYGQLGLKSEIEMGATSSVKSGRLHSCWSVIGTEVGKQIAPTAHGHEKSADFSGIGRLWNREELRRRLCRHGETIRQSAVAVLGVQNRPDGFLRSRGAPPERLQSAENNARRAGDSSPPTLDCRPYERPSPIEDIYRRCGARFRVF